jgi:GntR family transcriptional regulator/MocR family aminotransferase
VPENRANLAWDVLLDVAGQPPGALSARLTGALRSAIRAGRVVAGSLLPPSRLLAAELGCSRWTVTEAYQQLVAEGYLEAHVGSGTRVVWREGHTRDAVRGVPVRRPPADRPRIDLSPGLPDLRAFPRDRWLAALRTAAAALPYQQLGYPAPGGEQQLREILADYLYRVRGAVVRPEDLVICGGVTDAVTRLSAVARAAGLGAIAMEDPGWPRLRAVVASSGLRLVPVAVDEYGLRVDDLEREPDVRLVVVSPAHQFPNGSVLAPQRRARLLEWARRVDGLVVEDDYDAEFRYDRRPVGTLQGADPDRVALAGSLSKTLSPALGIGWIATPPRWTPALRDLRPPGPGVLDQLAFAEFLSSGGYDRHLRATRKRYRDRRDALVEALAERLPGWTVSGAAAGLHLLLDAPLAGDGGGPNSRDVVRRAAAAGLEVGSAREYRVHNGALDPALVLGYGNLRDSEVTTAVDLLAAVLASASG